MSELISSVHVRAEDGTNHVFGPDSDVPDWAQKKITNPAAWKDGDVPSVEEEPDNGEPARAGRGSSLTVWAAYAHSLDIEVPEGATRDDVIKLVDEKKAAQA